MSARVLTRRLAVVPAAAGVVDAVPGRIARLAAAGGWATCDVCAWPVVPAATVAGRRPRHPGCVCCVCDAPLLAGQVEPGVIWHPQCCPAVARPVVTVVGGAQ